MTRIEGSSHTHFVGDVSVMSVDKRDFTGGTPITEMMPDGDTIAFWGPTNDHPERVNDDIARYPLMSAVLERDVDMMVGGNVRYGHVKAGPGGYEELELQQIPEIDDWMEESQFQLAFEEAFLDYRTYATCFYELVKNKRGDRIAGVVCQDAGDVRLNLQNARGEITKAYLADWQGGAMHGDAVIMPTVDAYWDPADQIRAMKQSRMILPVRLLNRGRRYYGQTPWDGLRSNGMLDIAVRIPMLKKTLITHVTNLRFHVEADERLWPILYKSTWDKLNDEQRGEKKQKYFKAIDNWLKKEGIGGVYGTGILPGQQGKGQESMVKINEKRFVLPDGTYIEDSQEVDFITCRDMGVKPSLHGISPSKSGSSPGSGSEDRVARNNHILDKRRHLDRVINVMNPVSKVNGWRERYGPLRFWTNNYYAATLDRTNQVGGNKEQ